MYVKYKQLCKEGEFCPGDVFDYDYGGGHIYNLGTQVTWRTQAEIEYIEGSLDRMLYLAVCNDVKAIGAGLGGLKWDDVKRCIERVASSYSMVDLYVVEAYQGENEQ